MIIDIGKILKSAVGSSFETKIALKPTRLDREIEVEKPVKGTVLLTKLDNEILGNFKIKTRLNLLCFRCAKNFSKNIKLEFNQIYFFTDYKKANIINGEKDFVIGEDGKLDPWPAIRQEILLNLPMKILCKKTCKGICPYCGQNLNSKKCKCKSQLRVQKVRQFVN